MTISGAKSRRPTTWTPTSPEGTNAMSELREYTVGTFWHPNSVPHKRASALLKWYSPEWRGCIEFTVRALNGPEAKKAACLLRRRYEEQMEAEANLDAV